MNLSRWLEKDLRGVDDTPLSPARIQALESILTEIIPTSTLVTKILRMKSRKNVVLLIEIQTESDETSAFVAKLFVNDTFEKELNILRRSNQAGLRVPEIISAKDGVILMEFVPGESLVDEIHRTYDESIINELAEWYYNYHQIHTLTKGDSRLRNFIVTSEGLCGIDFEEAESDHWMCDIAGAGASLLDTDPIFDRKKVSLAHCLLDKYLELSHTEKDSEIERHFIKTLADTLEQTAKWRDSTEILDLSRRIRKQGLRV